MVSSGKVLMRFLKSEEEINELKEAINSKNDSEIKMNLGIFILLFLISRTF